MIDISNPAIPVLAENYDTAGDAHGVFVAGDQAYVADGGSGLQVIRENAGDEKKGVDSLDRLRCCGLQLFKQFEKIRFIHFPLYALEYGSLRIRDYGGRCGADGVTAEYFGHVRIICVHHQGNEPFVNFGCHLFVRPDGSFHDSTGRAPFCSEEKDHGFIGLHRLFLSYGVVRGPGHAV